MLLLSWELVKKKELYHLCWILQMLVQWSFDSEGSLLLDCGRVVFATPKDCCYWWCHIFKDFLNFLFGTKIVVDRIFARSLLIALPENKNHLIFDAFVKTLLTKFFRITWKQRTFQFCLLISTRSREAYTWCFRGKRPTSHQPNRMLMREKGEQRVFLICIPFGSCEVQCLTPITSFWRGHVIFAGVAFGTLIPEDR